MTSRTAAALTLTVLGAALVAIVALGTPWRPSEAPAGGRAEPTVSSDFTAEQLHQEKSFHSALRPWSLTGTAVALAVAVVLGLTPVGAWIVSAVARPFGGGWVWQALFGGVTLGLVGQLATLPFAARAHAILRTHGLSAQTWGGWAVDLAKAWAVTAVLGAGALLTFYAVVRASPRWWWAWVAPGLAAVVIALTFVAPVVLEPLFNRFTPMPPSPLRTELMELAARSGHPVRDVLVADASRRTAAFNAYVSGFGATRRIVVYDTLLKEAPEDEIRLVIAHELGHAVRQDVLRGTVVAALAAACAVCAGYLLLGWTPLLHRAGVTTVADPRSVGLLLALVALAGFLTLPGQNLLSRRIEAHADEHALRLTREPAAFIAMQRRLATRNLSALEPNPVLYTWFSSHPTAPQRIAQARDFARRERIELRVPPVR